MVDYKYSELYTKDNIDKQLTIKTDDSLVTITNTELHQEQFELSESLCSESELRFGCCEASSIKFKISNVFTPLNGKWLTVTETLDGNTDVSFQFGRYKVNSDKPSADRTCRDVIAYDAMYDIINADVADWYNTILPDKASTVTLKEFRTSFVEYFGLEQEEIDLVNDGMVIEKTIEPSEISGKDVITAICEINGCFGHIGRNGKFKYILLPKYIQGLYPANDLYPEDDLYLRNPNTTKISNSLYISCQYEDFVTRKIDKLQIRQTEDDMGSIVGKGVNCYIVEDNFLVYGKSADDLETIAKNLFSVISNICYRPFEADCKGNPCFEVGDAVRITTKYEIVESYVFKRTLKGIQALRDDYSSDGVLEYAEKVNSVNRSIIQLKGKTNELERTVEETKSTINDVERDFQTQITQNAERISAEAIRAKNSEDELSAKVQLTAESITAEAKRAQSQEVELAAAISVNAQSITSKVSKNSVVSEINQSAEGVQIKAELLELKGNVEMTGGSVHIEADASVDNIIELKRPGTDVAMGTDGVRARADYREAVFQYSNITVQNTSSGSIAQMLPTGYGICSFEWQTYSDRRLKHDIEYLDKKSSVELIMSLKPCQFVYDYDNSGAIRHGFIAQDVMEVVGDAWEVCGKQERDGEEYFTLDKSNLIADLIATVQLQNEQISKLNERITALEERLNE